MREPYPNGSAVGLSAPKVAYPGVCRGQLELVHDPLVRQATERFLRPCVVRSGRDHVS